MGRKAFQTPGRKNKLIVSNHYGVKKVITRGRPFVLPS
jgi:hypothetical protein